MEWGNKSSMWRCNCGLVAGAVYPLQADPLTVKD